MPTLPQLVEEDIQQFDQVLGLLLEKSEATTVLVIDQGGFLIHSNGDTRNFDVTTIAALASGAYLANQTIAGLVHETNFSSVYQQGEQFSMFAQRVDEFSMLVVIFKATVSVGLVRYFAIPAAERIAERMRQAQQRDPEGGLDLSVLNMADASSVFKRRDA